MGTIQPAFDQREALAGLWVLTTRGHERFGRQGGCVRLWLLVQSRKCRFTEGQNFDQCVSARAISGHVEPYRQNSCNGKDWYFFRQFDHSKEHLARRFAS